MGQDMKLLNLSFFAASVFAESDIFADSTEANSVLRNKRFLGDILGTTAAAEPKSYEEQKQETFNKFIDDYHLTSVEAWGELKEVMEGKKRADVPEEKVDELESCVSSCKRKEKWLQFGPGDKSIEEQKENQEEKFEKCTKKGEKKSKCDKAFDKKLIPCPKCFRYVPIVTTGFVDELTGGILKDLNPVDLLSGVIG